MTLNLRAATADLMGGVALSRMWLMLGSMELKSRYRRTTLGPLWASISMAMQAIVSAFVLGYLFKQSIAEFLPFLCLSLALWYFVTNTVQEGAMAFAGSTDLIMQVRRPFSFYILKTIWRNIILAGHNLSIFFIVAAIFALWPTFTWLLSVPGIIILVVNVAWLSLFFAIASARFGDVPLLVQNGFTMLFWLTPVLYRPTQLGDEVATIVGLNPLTHIIEVARAPLLNLAPTSTNWIIAIAAAVIGWAVTLLLFARTRNKIAFWV